MNREKLVVILSVVLGSIFIVAGVGKIFSVNAFASTIAQVTHIGQISHILAGAVVLLEIIGGVGLVLRYRVTLISTLMCGLVAVFIWVLTLAIFQGREINCHYFGILDVGLSNRAELVLNIGLFNLFAILALLSSMKETSSQFRRKLWLTIGVAAVFYLQYSMFASILRQELPKRQLDLYPLLTYVEAQKQAFTGYARHNRLLFLLYFPDFNCPPCLDDFLTLSDIFHTRYADETPSRALAIFKPDAIANPGEPIRLTRWAQASELPFPILIAPDSLFERVGFVKSSAVVLSPTGETLFWEVLPIGAENMERVLQLLDVEYASHY